MSELLMVWGDNPTQVQELLDVRAGGRTYRVVRRDHFALISVESTKGKALNSETATFCIVATIT